MQRRLESRGSRALAEAMQLRGARAALTRELRCGNGLIGKWCAGERTPTVRFALAIERVQGIPVAWWAEPATPARRRKADSAHAAE